MLTIKQLLNYKRKKKTFSKKTILNKQPQIKGICLKVSTMTPKKPNSALRKIAKIKLSNKKICIAYIPGEKHSVQDHNFVLIKGGRVKDLPGVKCKIIRGALDVAGVSNRMKSRSKYGSKKLK